MSTSSSTKRKHVYSELLQSELQLPSEGQEIVRVTGGRGNYLHDAESASGDTFIISMPSKFRNNVWVKRGNYVVVERILEGDKEYTGEDDTDLYLEERELALRVAQDEKRRIQMSVPGILNPHEIPEEMQD